MADIVQGLVDLGLGVYDRFIGDPKCCDSLRDTIKVKIGSSLPK